MTTATIEELAYLIKQAKKEGLPQPIVFLGAGASKSGGVPLAGEIITDILDKYKDSPKIKALKDIDKTYPKLMECLTPFERNKLLKEYIDKAKINVTHIYLAQLLIMGYVDYVLTVNFDNLMLRALALFNSFPATYDMAILKDLTTTTFKKESVIYLHGQHHGLWLLNTREEMDKVKEIIPPILNSIKNQRPWIFIGYSGEDPIFEHILKLGRFDNGLYWVTYHDNTPNDTVCNNLLSKTNTNALLVNGYDADSFMLKLNSELELPQPLIIDKPFTSLKQTLENIVDVDDKEHFKGVKERLEIVKNDVSIAIEQFEEGKFDLSKDLKKEIDIGLLKKQIIDKMLKTDFNADEIDELEKTALLLNNEEINTLISGLYNNWGASLFEKTKNKETCEECIKKYEKAIELNPNNNLAYNNWGSALLEFAKLTNDESYYARSFEKFKTATELNPNSDSAFYNWGYGLFDFAKKTKEENLFYECFEKFKTATELNPKKEKAYSTWGNALSVLAEKNNDPTLYEQSIEKFKTIIELNPKSYSAYYKLGGALTNLAKLNNEVNLFNLALETFKKAKDLGGESYNMACLYAIRKDKNNALETLKDSLIKKEIESSFVLNDKDWEEFKTDPDFIDLLKTYTS